jgi:hypothetical protein
VESFQEERTLDILMLLIYFAKAQRAIRQSAIVRAAEMVAAS